MLSDSPYKEIVTGVLILEMVQITSDSNSIVPLASVHINEQDWLFEKLLGQLKANKHIILVANQCWGVQGYVKELGFRLEETDRSFQACYMDMSPAHNSSTFLDIFGTALSRRFPVLTSQMMSKSSTDVLRLPEWIAKKEKINLAFFLANSHLFTRLSSQNHFLRKLNLKLKNQKNCVFCLYGHNNPHFIDLVKYPGPLSGLGRVYNLNHNPLKDRSVSIRKLFHDHNKRIGYNTSAELLHMVDNHPFYIKLLAWHALLKTTRCCTPAILENAMTDLIHHFDNHFIGITESLTAKQLRFLKALLEGNKRLHSKATMDKYELGKTGHVTRIKKSLEIKRITDTSMSEIVFTDPLFKEWLRRQYFAEM